jgi:putative DNA primase/helicase
MAATIREEGPGMSARKADSKDPKRPKDGDAKAKKDAAEEIVLRVVQPEVERGNLELFHTPSRVAFATARIKDHYENFELNSSEFKDLLCRAIYTATGSMPSDAALKKVLRILRGEALYGEKSRELPVFHRIAEASGNIYLDLCDQLWRVVEITPSGWWLKENAPVRFVRSSVSRPLPEPKRGGNLDDIFELVNINRRSDRVLFLSCMVGALQTHAAYPILFLCGSQGSAKSTAERILAGLIDPAEPQTVTGHSSERDLLIDAQFSHLICIDNLSEIKDQFSDALCRLATGSGLRRRKLYSDSTLFALSAKNPLVMNGISQIATRGDLLDRMISLKLEKIPENKRRTEETIVQEFKAKRPALLGALLDAVSVALRKQPYVKVGHLPRMADFSTWVIAAESELGFASGEFLDAYKANRAEASDTSLEFSAIGLPVILLIDANAGSWEGSVKDLLGTLNARFDDTEKRDPDWPKNPRALRSALNRIDPNLEAAGYHVSWLKQDSHTRRRIVRIAKKSASPVEFRTTDAKKEEAADGR